jgi:hypothetical protein
MDIQKELIGAIGDRPVYKILGGNFTEIPFTINWRTLIIGDGDNTPIIFVKDALKAMFHYIIEDKAFDLNKYSDHSNNSERPDEEVLRYIVFDHDDRGHFYYHNFSTQNHKEFHTMCESNLLEVPYCKKVIGDFNQWLHVNIGSFVWFYYPDLTDLIAFSPCDYFIENYLENITVCNKLNIVGISDNQTYFQYIVEYNKGEIISHPIISSIDELEFLGNEVWAGNHWDLNNVYCFYLYTVKK